MMAGYACNGSFEEVLELFNLMKSYEIRMNKVAVASVLQAAAHVGDLEKGIEIHEYVVQQGMIGDVSVATSLMSTYAKCGEQAGHQDGALSLFSDTISRYVKRNGVTLTSVLPACAGIAASRLVTSIHCYAMKTCIDCELATANCHSYYLNVCKMWSLCSRTQNRYQSVAFNAVAQGYTQIGDAGRANEMKLHGVVPDSGTMVGLLQTCALCSEYDRGCCVYGKIIKHGFESESHMAHDLTDMFTQCDALAAAKPLFDKCGLKKNTVSWNIMMNRHLIQGQAEEAIATFRQ